MIKKISNSFSNQLIKSKELFKKSFIDQQLDLSDKHLKLLSRYIGSGIYYTQPLPSRKFFVSVIDADDFHFSKKKTGKSIEVIFYLFLIQTSSGMYLIVASSFDVYSVLDREPYHESLGEFKYQARLAKAVGFKNAVAYDLSSKMVLDEDRVINEDLELMYCGDKRTSFFIFAI